MITTNIIERRFAGDGMTTFFPVDIEGIPDAPTGANHVALTRIDANAEQTPLVYGADFSLSANIVNGFSKSVAVTLKRPLSAGETLVVRRTTPVASISSYPEDRTPPRQVERDVDNLVKIAQEQAEGITDLERGLAEETEARIEGDRILTEALEAETAARIAGDKANAESIEAEEDARKKADADEASARVAADNALGGRIDAEASERTGADAALAAAITTETTERKQSDATEQAERIVADKTLREAIDGKADVSHSHEIGGVAGLEDALAEKANKGDLGGMAYVDDAPDDSGQYVRQNGKWELSTGGGGEGGVTNHANLTGRDAQKQHPIEAIDGLVDALACKANLVHTHEIANVVGLWDVLNGKAASEIFTSNVLEGIGNAVVSQAVINTGFRANFAAANGSLEFLKSQSDSLACCVATLENIVQEKADTEHSHTIPEVTNLQQTLNLKAPLASPAFTGAPTAPTPATSDSSPKIATTAFTKAALAGFSAGAPKPIATAGVGQWFVSESMEYLPAGGTWAYFIPGVDGSSMDGYPIRTGATGGVIAGGTRVNARKGILAWRIA